MSHPDSFGKLSAYGVRNLRQQASTDHVLRVSNLVDTTHHLDRRCNKTALLGSPTETAIYAAAADGAGAEQWSLYKESRRSC